MALFAIKYNLEFKSPHVPSSRTPNTKVSDKVTIAPNNKKIQLITRPESELVKKQFFEIND